MSENLTTPSIISIHALLAESDSEVSERVPLAELTSFLSTLSLRRATNDSTRRTYQQGEFLSTLSLRRATDQGASNQRERQISIHALLAESDAEAIKPS